MPREFPKAAVSVILLHAREPGYDREAFRAGVQAALAQDYDPLELIVVDYRGPDAPLDFLPPGTGAERIRHLPGNYANRAEGLNAACRSARGDYLLLVINDTTPVVLRRSALRTMLMAAQRRPEGEERPVGMVYADYERRSPDGRTCEVHLLDWHPGRLRETTDFGAVWLLSTEAVRTVGGWNSSYEAADLYDLRLRLSEHYRLVHVANRFAGSLYTVFAPATAHNVFAYLLTDKAAQRELERACTEHLKRIGAYLAPGAHVRHVPRETNPERECLASVVIPVYRRPEFIGRAIESVQRQTVRAVEAVVVVNGGEEDPTADEVRRYMPGGDRHDPAAPPVRLVVVDVNNLGLCLNAGLTVARGRYYVQLDSDDRLKPDAVEKLLEVFASDPTVGMVIGSYEVWTLDEQTGTLHRNEEIPVVKHEEWTPDNGRNNLLRINGAGAPRAALIDVIAEVGWFGVNDTPQCRNYGEDYDLVLRISERYTIGRVWDPIYEVIRHSGGTDHAIDQATIDRNDEAKDAMRLEALRRRQALNRRG